MKRNLISIVALTGTLLLAGNVWASPLGQEITISDNESSTNYDWYSDREDNEVEPGMLRSQAWDLEGFFLDGTKLSTVGGFDFVNGVPNYPAFTSGDLFLDVTGDATYGVDGANIRNGYDYVLDLDFGTNSFNVFKIDDNATLLDVANYNRPESSPWKYGSGGTEVVGAGGSIEYIGYADFANNYGEMGLYGGMGKHNAFTVDLSFLLGMNDFTGEFISHFTQGCGNDNLMGQGAPVPEPATMLLFGTGLVGLAGAARRRKK
ncbi:PEP-CTERM sorting domain-containing protein [Thermodesulfobacteriota bacterium]